MEQPYLHHLSVVVAAPQQCWSGADGQIRPSPIQGIYCCDVRIASEVVLGAGQRVSEPIGSSQPGGDQARFDTVWRTPEFGADPAVVWQRERTVSSTGVRERILIRSAAPQDVEVPMMLVIRPDNTPMSAVRASVAVGEPPRPVPTGDGSYVWKFGRSGEARFAAPGAQVLDRDGAVWALWQVTVPAHDSTSIDWEVEAEDPGFPFVHSQSWGRGDRRRKDPLDLLVQTARRDLASLRMADRDEMEHTFYAAGAPWFLTLFGRDSLLAARLSLPWDPDMAVGTLRALAARQGTKVDPATAEQPGKIPHEVRGEALRLYGSGRQAGGSDIVLPPVYYGTIDATCLWIALLGDLVATGADETGLRSLLPNLRAALGWLRDYGDADGDGFLEYADTGQGLSNQGWKDSADSIRWADGSLATSPIALCEVQGYAHEAALVGAWLLERWGHADEGAPLRAWASGIAQRFRERFWVRDELGPYPAIALDAAKRPVTGVSSNMGHLLGTGILTLEESRAVVKRLMHPTMRSGYGIRTLSIDNGGYWPLGYHVGSVWTHDNGVILLGMLRSRFVEEARVLASELLRAAVAFDYRLPELYAGHSSDETAAPLPFPAACHPQAWAAAATCVIERALRTP